VDEAFKEENKNKNRYAFVVPYDSTRVKLPVTPSDENEASDYINASYVQGEDSSFIATQGPLPDTFRDFWRMVWNDHVTVILMLTKTIENDRIKCHRYWPEDTDPPEQFIYGNFKVEPISIQEELDKALSIRKYHLTNLKEPDTPPRDVYQFQYFGWPDHGVPENVESVLDLMSRVDKIRQENDTKAPVVVHCSAGIGRTGAFCSIHIQSTKLRKHISANTAEKPFVFDVYNTVLGLRKQRTGMVQQPEQYRYIYEVLVHEAEKLGMKFSETEDEAEATSPDKKKHKKKHTTDSPDGVKKKHHHHHSKKEGEHKHHHHKHHKHHKEEEGSDRPSTESQRSTESAPQSPQPQPNNNQSQQQPQQQQSQEKSQTTTTPTQSTASSSSDANKQTSKEDSKQQPTSEKELQTSNSAEPLRKTSSASSVNEKKPDAAKETTTTPTKAESSSKEGKSETSAEDAPNGGKLEKKDSASAVAPAAPAAAAAAAKTELKPSTSKDSKPAAPQKGKK